MKKIVSTIAATALLLVSLVPSAFATSENSDLQLEIEPGIKIVKHKDGRIVPIPNVSKLTEVQVDKILREMNVQNSDLKDFPLEFKQNLVSRGGVKVELNSEKKQIYRDREGNQHIVTPENKEDIDRIRKNDEKNLKLDRPVSVLSMGSVSDGIFSAKAYLFYLGTTTNGAEYKYDYYTSYNWNGPPNFNYEDSVGQAWQSHTTRVTTNGAHNYQNNCLNPSTQQIPYDPNDDIKLSIGGSQSKFELYGSVCKQWGALHDEVRIPVGNKSQTGTFISSYAHPYSSAVVRAALNYLSISWDDFIGDEYNWVNTFTIGSSS
ncbi:hypothetical protein GK047_01925 [Paenibacillus sp. SYP-B3998]|uniref:Uncharacterized protein n=1 Tax=Paenibacillus sp. SYP-B3998 TaxID=2678564 RepID=A0A6G3ZTN4_9BACL|nr:hypothetical protein [Paenibacillus sp. SYP-B3998]NEW04777.1 hypothetical protein [Paenibacillus sp. SYP-B3998]